MEAITASRSSAPAPRLVVSRYGLGAELVDYQNAWELQREIHAEVVAGSLPSTVLLLEHAEVFTAGRRTQDSDRPTDGSAVIEVDRGGRITWHGSGQLVVYPIVVLPAALDVVAHVRRLEEIAILTCTDFGLAVTRIPGSSGVWCPATQTQPARKVAAVGVRVARGVTMHGLAINVNCDLSWSQRIVACGIADAGVSSMQAELGSPVGLMAVADVAERHVHSVLEPTLPSRSA